MSNVFCVKALFVETRSGHRSPRALDNRWMSAIATYAHRETGGDTGSATSSPDWLLIYRITEDELQLVRTRQS